jgi:hypothetical protein
MLEQAVLEQSKFGIKACATMRCSFDQVLMTIAEASAMSS